MNDQRALQTGDMSDHMPELLPPSVGQHPVLTAYEEDEFIMLFNNEAGSITIEPGYTDVVRQQFYRKTLSADLTNFLYQPALS